MVHNLDKKVRARLNNIRNGQRIITENTNELYNEICESSASKDIYYGWQNNDGKMKYMFNSKIAVACCFMTNVKDLKSRTDGKLVKFKITEIVEVEE